MLRVNAGTKLNDEKIECITIYADSLPLRRMVSDARKNNKCRNLNGNRKIKTMIIYNDGSIFLCSLNPDTYLARLDAADYYLVDPIRTMIRKNEIREIVSKTNASHRRDIAKAKADGMYVNLTCNRKTRDYIFTESGRIYGLAYIRSAADAN
ncbi:MAG: DUF370 domain-containing protein [Lachnospiraceae bacterium]|nr:DUF370 domain-containing protein [Lachnospiraceae bacterium]